MSIRTIWLVLGSAGEYSDRYEWPVAAFYKQEAAQSLCDRLSAEAREHELAHNAWSKRYWEAARGGGSIFSASTEQYALAREQAGPEPQWKDDTDHTGDNYWVDEVALHEPDTSTDVTCSVNSRQGNARPLHEHNREDD